MPRPASGDSLHVELGGSLPSKYEFYREYHPPPEDLENGPPCLKQWVVKRRTDGKKFGADKYDAWFIASLHPETRQQMLQILNHPNLNSLVDIVDGRWLIFDSHAQFKLYRLLDQGSEWSKPGFSEGFCWNMLDGLLQALVWLHYGFKRTFPFDRYMGHDKDWQPILAKTIHPYYISLAFPEPGEEYGRVKLSTARLMEICPGLLPPEVLPPEETSLYDPPEVLYNHPRHRPALWTPAAEVFGVGAILYHMMVSQHIWFLKTSTDGTNYNSTRCEKPLPKRYSPDLRNIVEVMLSDRDDRPTAAELLPMVGAGMAKWREERERKRAGSKKRKAKRLFPRVVKKFKFG